MTPAAPWDLSRYNHYQWNLIVGFFDGATDQADQIIADLSDILEEKTWKGGDMGKRYAASKERFEAFEAYCTEQIASITGRGVQKVHLTLVAESVVTRIKTAALKHTEDDGA